MRTRWFVLLSITTVIFASVVGFFIAYQFRASSYKPRFRLSEDTESDKTDNRKAIMEIKGNLISSITKNSSKNLKGPLPDCIEFDISNTIDQGPSSYVKVFETSYVDISGFKGYTHVFKAKLPVSKFFNKKTEQFGLPTHLELEAVLTYFSHDSINHTPLAVCAVSSIEDKGFSCYLMDSENNWSVSGCINSLDISDDSFGDRAGKCIKNHYKISKTTDGQPKDEGLSGQQEKYDSFELDISSKQGFENEHLTVKEIDRITVPGFQGFSFNFKNKSEITKFKFFETEQLGLPTGSPFELILTYYRQDKLDEYPVAVFVVKSKSTKSFVCYLMESQDSWQINDEIGQLKLQDQKFGEKVYDIINKHYSSQSNDLTDLSKEDEPTIPVETEPSENPEQPEEPPNNESSEEDVESELSEDQSTEDNSENDVLDLDTDLNTEDGDQNEQSLTKIPVLDISKTESQEGDDIEIQEFTELDIPKYRAFGHLFPNKSPVEKYESRGVEQQGLPINYPLEAVLNFFHEKYQDPLVVCAIYSMDDMMFDCYLKDSEVWIKNDQMSQLDFTSDDFSDTASKLVNAHYGIEDQTDTESN